MRKSVAIDMDDTIADTLSRHAGWYEKEFGIAIPGEDLKGARIHEIVPEEHMEAVLAYPHHPDFFAGLDLIDGAAEAIEYLSGKYDVYFATAAMEYPASFTAKYEWLQKHFPFISNMNYIFCGFKGILNCDFLIDDSPRHIDAFKGQGFLFTAPHNINESGYQRIKYWREIREIL